MNRWLRCVAGLGMALALSSTTTFAGADGTADEARAHFMRGVQHYNDGDYPSALIEFNRAYAIAPNYRVKYNVGSTCLDLHDYPCALRALTQFLAEGGDEIPAARREAVTKDLRRIHLLVARLSVRVNVPGAEIAVDDGLVGTSPLSESVLLVGGRHKVAVSLPPRPTVVRFVEITAGESSAIDVTLTDSAATAGTLGQPSSAAERPAERSKTPLVVGLGLSALLAGATATAGFMTLSAKSDLDDAANRFGVKPSEVSDARDDVKTRSLVTDVLAGATVLALAGTVVYYFVAQPSGKPKAALVPSGLGLYRSF